MRGRLPVAEYVVGRAADGTATYALDRESVRGLARVLAERRWTGSALETTYQMRDHLGGASKAAIKAGLDKAADAAVGLALPAPASPRAQAPRTTSGATLPSFFQGRTRRRRNRPRRHTDQSVCEWEHGMTTLDKVLPWILAVLVVVLVVRLKKERDADERRRLRREAWAVGVALALFVSTMLLFHACGVE